MSITGNKHLLSLDKQIDGLLKGKGREKAYKILKENTLSRKTVFFLCLIKFLFPFFLCSKVSKHWQTS